LLPFEIAPFFCEYLAYAISRLRVKARVTC
jgi:hypothetical protein